MVRKVRIKKTPVQGSKSVDAGKKVDRDKANIEVEKGETALGDLNNDGFLEFVKYKGKKHSEGGTPVNISDGTFVFSNTPKMSVKDPEMLKLFGVTNTKSKKGKTYADLSKQYDITEYMNVMRNEESTDLEKHTADLMIKKNMDKLGMLALMQENDKGFPEGIPDIASIAMGNMGISPEQFMPPQGNPNNPNPGQPVMDGSGEGQGQGMAEMQGMAKYGRSMGTGPRDGSQGDGSAGFCNTETLSKFCGGGNKLPKAQNGLYNVNPSSDDIYYNINSTDSWKDMLSRSIDSNQDDLDDFFSQIEDKQKGLSKQIEAAYNSGNEEEINKVIAAIKKVDFDGWGWMPGTDEDDSQTLIDVLTQRGAFMTEVGEYPAKYEKSKKTYDEVTNYKKYLDEQYKTEDKPSEKLIIKDRLKTINNILKLKIEGNDFYFPETDVLSPYIYDDKISEVEFNKKHTLFNNVPGIDPIIKTMDNDAGYQSTINKLESDQAAQKETIDNMSTANAEELRKAAAEAAAKAAAEADQFTNDTTGFPLMKKVDWKYGGLKKFIDGGGLPKFKVAGTAGTAKGYVGWELETRQNNNGTYIVKSFDGNGKEQFVKTFATEDEAAKYLSEKRTLYGIPQHPASSNNKPAGTGTGNSPKGTTYDTEDKEINDYLKSKGYKFNNLPDQYRYTDKSIGAQYDYDADSGFYYDKSRSNAPGAKGLEEFKKLHAVHLKNYKSERTGKTGADAWSEDNKFNKTNNSPAMRYLVGEINKDYKIATDLDTPLIDVTKKGAYVPGVELFNMGSIDHIEDPADDKGDDKGDDTNPCEPGFTFNPETKKCEKAIKCPPGTTEDPESGECIPNDKNILRKDNRAWLPDIMGVGTALTQQIYNGDLPYNERIDLENGDYSLVDPTRNIQENQETAAMLAETVASGMTGPAAMAAAMAIQNNTSTQNANVISAYGDKNSQIINNFLNKSADINNKEEIFNKNALKKYMAETEILKQNRVNDENAWETNVSNQLINTQKNKIDTRMFEDYYPQYATNKFTGERFFTGNDQPIFDEEGNMVFDPSSKSGKGSSLTSRADEYNELVKKFDGDEEKAKIVWNSYYGTKKNASKNDPNYYGADYTSPMGYTAQQRNSNGRNKNRRRT